MLVYTSPDLPMVGHLKNILESFDIPCTIRKQFSSAAVGEIPPVECWPELWVVDFRQVERAKKIVKEALNPQIGHLSQWECPDCNELLDGQFTACWKCGTERT